MSLAGFASFCGVDFGVTQVVDGNFGVHAIIRKDIFSGGDAWLGG